MRTRFTAVTAAGAVGAAMVVMLLAGCVAPTMPRGDAHPQRLPLGLPVEVVLACERSVGLGDSAVAPTFWRDSQGVHMRIGHSKLHRTGRGSSGATSNTESAMLSCLNVATGPLQQYPADSASQLLLWKYSTTVLWPCISEHDIDPGPPPSRADILTGDPLLVDPFARLHSRISAARLAQLHIDCPALPTYLTASTG